MHALTSPLTTESQLAKDGIAIRSGPVPLPTPFLAYRRQTGNYPETGLWEAPNSDPQMPTKSTRYGRIPQLLIALHSPNGLLETGLRVCPPEKSQDRSPFAAEQSVLCSPVCLPTIAKYGHYSRISALSERNFS